MKRGFLRRWTAWGEVTDGGFVISQWSPVELRSSQAARRWVMDWHLCNLWGGPGHWPHTMIRSPRGELMCMRAKGCGTCIDRAHLRRSDSPVYDESRAAWVYPGDVSYWQRRGSVAS